MDEPVREKKEKYLNETRRQFLKTTFGFGAGVLLVSLFSGTEESRANSCCYNDCYSNCYMARGRR